MASADLRAAARGSTCVGLALVVLAGCGLDVNPSYPVRSGREIVYTDEKPGSIFGREGISFGGRKLDEEPGGGGIGVNSYLWRASLDTIAFMPLASADPFGGVIITDWYTPPETPNERFKMTVYILDRRLRADGIRVAVFRQARDGANGWNDVAIRNGTVTDLENAILTRARQLRIASLPRE